ncbi:MAG: ribonuclease P protein component [Chloroflexota bacterium]
MDRRFRLTRSSDFKRVRRAGKSYAHPLAVLVACRNGLPKTRFAISAAHSLGSAVARNRAKRRLREAIRHWMPRVTGGWDALLIARPEVNAADWPAVLAAVERLMLRAQLIREDD